MSFLNAEWRKLVLINYIIDPGLLKSYVPYGTEIDLWKDQCYVSLVGFMFLDTHLLGIKIPLHINFEEVNLRFYVRPIRDPSKRGVVFIKEIVPRHALTFVANTFYREHYQTLPMMHSWSLEPDKVEIEYAWKIGQLWQKIHVEAASNTQLIDKNSDIEFITEHYWGYTKINEKRTSEYEVTHPTWEHYPVTDWTTKVDFGLTYGEKFSFLNQLDPASVILAEGSRITVEQKKNLVF